MFVLPYWPIRPWKNRTNTSHCPVVLSAFVDSRNCVVAITLNLWLDKHSKYSRLFHDLMEIFCKSLQFHAIASIPNQILHTAVFPGFSGLRLNPWFSNVRISSRAQKINPNMLISNKLGFFMSENSRLFHGLCRFLWKNRPKSHDLERVPKDSLHNATPQR